MHSSLPILAAGLAVAAAKTIVITGGKGGLNFSPSSSSAEVGDTLEFHFIGSFHNAVQGDFSTPCGRGAGAGFNSGMIKNGADGSGSVFQVQVKDTNPIYFYCGTPSHCQGGMVGAINAPTSGNTLDAYKTAAASTSSSELGPTVQGGVVVPVGTNPPSDTSSSASAPAQSSSSEAAGTESGSSTQSSAAAETSSGSAPSTTGAAETPAPTTSDAASTSKAATTPSPTIVPASGAVSLIGSAGNTAFAGVVAVFGVLMAMAL